MEELLQRLSALDPAAGDAVRAIAYFDALVEQRAGLDAFVRAGAILSGCTAGLADPDRHVLVRIHPDGHRLEPAAHIPSWPDTALRGTTAGRVWLERTGVPLPTDAIVLERLAAGAGIVLDRTRGRAATHDPAGVEVLLSPETTPEARALAVRRLALPAARFRVAALLGNPDDPAISRWSTRLGRVTAAIVVDTGAGPTTSLGPAIGTEHGPRAGLGPAVEVSGLPRSWHGALTALRLTAETHGPRHLAYDALGGLALLAEHVSPQNALIEDVRALRAAAGAGIGALETLAALEAHDSLRQAAAALQLHHSSLQARLPKLTAALGFAPDTPHGRTRLHLALALHRLNLNGPLP